MCSVSTDHHSARAETSVVLCVEVPEDALVPGDGNEDYVVVHDDGDGGGDCVHGDGDQGGGNGDCVHGDGDEDGGEILPSGSTWQIETIEISKPATIEPPVMIIIIMNLMMKVLIILMMIFMMIVMMIMMMLTIMIMTVIMI